MASSNQSSEHGNTGWRVSPVNERFCHLIALLRSPDGHAVLSGHADGSIYAFYFDDGSRGAAHSKFGTHMCAPTCLGWGTSIVAAGPDRKVSFYSVDGAIERTHEPANDDDTVRAFTSIAVSPSGESVVLGNFDKLLTYTFNSRNEDWVLGGTKDIPNLYTATALAWRADGSRIALGGLCGGADLFDAALKRVRYQGKFEFTYVSLSQVIVKRLSSGMRIVLRSSFGCEITKINVFQDRFLVANTSETLLMGDLLSCKLSEVPWHTTGTEKFHFDNPKVCMVYGAGELTLVEYGRNEPLGSCRTEHMTPHLVSVRVNERPPVDAMVPGGAASGAGGRLAANDGVDNKKLAYMLDAATVRVIDLASGAPLATVAHDGKVDWVELNGRCNLLLYRDKRLKLHLYDIVKQSRSTLLSSCTYVQWVPSSDVVVAQSRNNLCVWYNIYAPDKVTSYEIKGDIEDIERAEGKTEVIVDEGMNTASYVLDEGMIAFGTAVEDRHYESAMAILEGLEFSPETEAMWQQLAGVALEAGELQVAQRAAAALGDVSKARFLNKTSKIAAMAQERTGGDGRDFWEVRARLAQLRGDLQGAEGILLEQGKVDEAISMYEQLLKFDDAIGVAESRGHPNAQRMRKQYFNYLLSSGQEDKAAALKESEGDALAAIDLYIKGGLPGKAYGVVAANPSAFQPPVLSAIAAALEKGGLQPKAGALYERMGEAGRAMEAYVNGHDFRSAVELARRKYPAEVVKLEKMWGDWLVSQKQTDAAINHYLEAAAHTAAISAAISARQFSKAKQLVSDTLSDGEKARPFWQQLARHYSEAGMLDEAEQSHIRAGDGYAAVQMYLKVQRWEAAHRVAVGVLPAEDVTRLFVDAAQQSAVAGDLRSAEKLFLLSGQVELAIQMYRRAKEYDAMVRLVATHRRGDLKVTHLHLARQLAGEKDLKGAERHYCEAGEWSTAAKMFKEAGLWDDAARVAKLHGGPDASHQVAYEHAMAIGGEEGAKLLHRQGLIEQGIEYYCEKNNFEQALALAAKHKPHRVPYVHVKHAMYLEDNGQFAASEQAFIKGNKPREAIDMYLHAQDWPGAMRVAENYDPACIPDVLVSQAAACAGAGDYGRAEALYVDAKKPELAVQMYLEGRNFPEAVRVTKRHLPHRLKEVNDTIARQVAGGGNASVATMPAPLQRGGDMSPPGAAASSGGGGGAAAAHGSKDELLSNARMWEQSQNWGMAIDTYLSLNSSHESNADALVATWDQAVRLAATHERKRFLQVCGEVGRRLAAMHRWSAAGDLLRDGEQWKECIDAYIEAGAWEKARGIARSAAPMYRERVERAYKASLAEGGDGEGMAAAGDVDAALGMLAQQGKWERVFQLASEKGNVVLAKYAIPYAERALSERKVTELVRLGATYGFPGVASQMSLYRRIVQGVFGGPSSSAASDDTLVHARALLYSVVGDLKQSRDTPKQVMADVEALLMALHYAGMRARARQLGLKELAAQLSIALLRFIPIVPCDRAFYEAGVDAREVGWRNVAFVMLNRYVDLADEIGDALEDSMAGGAAPEVDFGVLDNSDFEGTEVPAPGAFRLPAAAWLSGSARDEVRDWVLAISMDQQVKQELPNGSVPLTSQASWPKCIVTGYPVPSGDAAKCPSCGSNAIKGAWNAVVAKSKQCPWCAAAANPMY